MNNDKKSSIDWLFLMVNNPNYTQEMALKCLKEAKRIHEEEIKNAYEISRTSIMTSKQYYEETFGNNTP
jgi:hypothetical protein